ncbi:DUF488 family protein [Chamaesiphon sp.]|uniref:DUF488 family protein n=1 Tax=Chamaesiphon sp. TaxID=2814140 RepID=UPI0035943555
MKQLIRGITLHRPWSYAIAKLGKPLENRSWECPLPTGSYLAIHSGSKWDTQAQQAIERITATKVKQSDDPPGQIIAIAKFTGNITASSSPWFIPGNIGWQLEDITPIEPIPARGQQGLWELSPELLDRVRIAYQAARIKFHDIYTFGYGNRTDYTELLECFDRNSISTLIDVRAKPHAWSPIWDGSSISNFCTDHTVKYQSLPQLGNTSGTSLWIPPDLTQARVALSQVTNLLRTGNVLLVCAEKNHKQCHRVEIALQLQDRTGGSSSITHKS